MVRSRSAAALLALVVLALGAASGAPAGDAGETDVFGILEKYPTARNGKTWTSEHWADGKPRTVSGRDPGDPTGMSASRSDQAEVRIDGKGVLEFRGSGKESEPRLHIDGGSPDAFRNVEITFYYRKEEDHDVDWAGMVVGARSGAEGHSGEPCDAHTYYGRFRNDGRFDFEKELKHPASLPRPGGNIWGGVDDLPAGKWIGMKYAVYDVTVNGKPGVRLELDRDLAEGKGGGSWEKVGETVDTGGWAPPQNDGPCPGRPPDYVPLTGGVIVLRNTGVERASYKWMTVREIAPPASGSSPSY
jgi:hypothetical protein